RYAQPQGDEQHDVRRDVVDLVLRAVAGDVPDEVAGDVRKAVPGWPIEVEWEQRRHEHQQRAGDGQQGGHLLSQLLRVAGLGDTGDEDVRLRPRIAGV